MGSATYARRAPEKTVLHQVVAGNLEAFLARARERSPDGQGLPRYVVNSFRRYLDCGILERGFVRVRCRGCGYDAVVAFS